MKDIEFNIKGKEKEIKISFDKDKIIKLPDGNNLGKLIVDKYLKSSKCQSKETKINLSKEYNILVDETAFYAKIINTVPAKDKMIKITNKDRQASNNEIMNEIKPQNVINENNENYYNDEMFGYNEEEKEEGEQGENESVKQQQPEEKKNFIMGFFSKFFSNDNNSNNSNNNNKNNIIKKKISLK